MRTSGSGKAFQLAALSAALTVQDQSEALAATTTLATVAEAMALARYAATGDDRHIGAIEAAERLARAALERYQAACAAAATVLRDFPSG